MLLERHMLLLVRLWLLVRFRVRRRWRFQWRPLKTAVTVAVPSRVVAVAGLVLAPAALQVIP